jgi:CelD/BcsL family acetyltransferase involved in cellulose biosynthesis
MDEDYVLSVMPSHSVAPGTISSHDARSTFFDPDAAGRWNQLWRQADVTTPAARAEAIACWVEAFSTPDRFRLIFVERDGEPRIALPLILGGIRYPAPAVRLPGNEWGLCGELLLDQRSLADADWDAFFAELSLLRRWLYCLEPVPLEAVRWRLFVEQAVRRGWHVRMRPLFDSPLMRIDGTWEQYLKGRSRTRRRNRARGEKLLHRTGTARFTHYADVTETDAESLVRRVFDVEHRSWKGRAGTSVRSVPHAETFYVELARRLADVGFLEFSFLELNGQPIAAAFGWRAKGDHFLVKIGYDEDHAIYGPGQLLVMELLRRCFEDRGGNLDFCGQAEPWSLEWSTGLVPLGRIDLVPPDLASRSLYHAYAALRRRAR